MKINNKYEWVNNLYNNEKIKNPISSKVIWLVVNNCLSNCEIIMNLTYA